jgi:hypothetical protein
VIDHPFTDLLTGEPFISPMFVEHRQDTVLLMGRPSLLEETSEISVQSLVGPDEVQVGFALVRSISTFATHRMINKYVITFIVSTTIWAMGCQESEPTEPIVETPGPSESDPEPEPEHEPEELPPPPEGPRHEAGGISYVELEGGEYEDETTQGIASSRVTLPSGVIFSVISSPDIVPPDQAQAMQLENARTGAGQRGEIIADEDAPSRPFVIGEPRGRRLIYRTRSGGIVHTEVFTFALGRRTVTVFIELTDPPDRHTEVVETLTRSLRVEMP